MLIHEIQSNAGFDTSAINPLDLLVLLRSYRAPRVRIEALNPGTTVTCVVEGGKYLRARTSLAAPHPIASLSHCTSVPVVVGSGTLWPKLPLSASADRQLQGAAEPKSVLCQPPLSDASATGGGTGCA